MILNVFLLCHRFCDNGKGMEMYNVADVLNACGQSVYTYVTSSSYIPPKKIPWKLTGTVNT